MKKTLLLSLIAFLALGLGVAFAQDDPFAGLGGGGDQGLGAPDGASSIRAKKKASPSTFEGRVEAVVKKDPEFPKVQSLTIKITKAPTDKTGVNAEIQNGKALQFVLELAMKDGKVDFAQKDNQVNIGAFYLEKGDKVEGEVKEAKDGKYLLSFIQRK